MDHCIICLLDAKDWEIHCMKRPRGQCQAWQIRGRPATRLWWYCINSHDIEWYLMIYVYIYTYIHIYIYYSKYVCIYIYIIQNMCIYIYIYMCLMINNDYVLGQQIVTQRPQSRLCPSWCRWITGRTSASKKWRSMDPHKALDLMDQRLAMVGQ